MRPGYLLSRAWFYNPADAGPSRSSLRQKFKSQARHPLRRCAHIAEVACAFSHVRLTARIITIQTGTLHSTVELRTRYIRAIRTSAVVAATFCLSGDWTTFEFRRIRLIRSVGVI
jgi:hypothetical protein